jgi:hypothetical protein
VVTIFRSSRHIKQLPVNCISLTTLVRRYGIQQLGILQIDTEGFDFEVIRSLDLTVVKPMIIHWEERHIPEPEQEECVQYLRGYGYSVFTEPRPNDSTAYLPSCIGE